MRSNQNEYRLKWYQRKATLIMFVIASILSIPIAIAEKDISYLFAGLLYIVISYFCYRSRIKVIKQSQNQSKNIEEIKTITYHDQPSEQVEQKSTHYKEDERENLKEVLRYSKIRKLLPSFVVLDFETTGLSPDRDKIIQVAAVIYRDFEKADEFLTYVNPQINIPHYITKINGITDKDVKNAPLINEVLPELIEFIGDDIIVAHNASFDLKFLLTNMYVHDIEYKRFRVVDTLSLARKYIDFSKNHKLETMKSFLKLNHLKSHDALHDCYVTAELYKYCYQESLATVSS